MLVLDLTDFTDH